MIADLPHLLKRLPGRILMGLTLILGLSLPAPAQTIQPTVDPLSIGFPAILTITSGPFVVAEGVLGVEVDGQLYLPLTEFSTQLGLLITVDPGRRTADGFYLDDANDFQLDLSARRVISAGAPFPVEDGMVLAAEDDLYLSVDALSQWLDGVTLTYDPLALTVDWQSRLPLPGVAAFQRNAARDGLGQGNRTAPDYARVSTPHRLIGPPVVDVSHQTFWDLQEGIRHAASFSGVNDLAFMSADWFVSVTDQQQPDNARLTLRRVDPAGQMLGPLGLSEVRLGDITQPSIPLVSGGRGGFGLSASTRPLDISSADTDIELRGPLPDGWEAELYRNDILIAFQDEPIAGEYIFRDVPLLPGTNRFEIRQFGPGGQQETVTRTVRLGGDIPPPGRWYAEGAVFMQRQQTIPVDDLLGVTQIQAEDNDTGQIGAGGRILFGVGPGWSISVQGATLSEEGARRHFAGLSSNFSLLGLGVGLNFAVDNKVNNAMGVRLTSSLLGFGTSFEHQEFRVRYTADVNNPDDRVIRRTQLLVSRSIPLPIVERPISTLFSGTYERFPNGDQTLETNTSHSFSAGGLLVGNTLEVDYDFPEGGVGTRSIRGNGNAAYDFGDLTLQGRLSYDLEPIYQGGTASLDALARPWEDWTFRVGSAYAIEPGTVRATAGVDWDTPYAALGLNGSYASADDDFSAALRLRFSLGWPDGIVPTVQRTSLSNRGLGYARVFIDNDGDGTFSEGDVPVEGATVSPSSADTATDEEGRLLLDGLATRRFAPVKLNTGSLEDPFLAPVTEGYAVLARPGAVISLDFPLVPVSDIEGMVELTEQVVTRDGIPLGSETRALSNVALILTNTATGEQAATQRSAYDGFFAFTGIGPGEYELSVDPAQLEQFSLDLATPLRVTVEPDSGIIPGLVVALTAREALVRQGTPDPADGDTSAEETTVPLDPVADPLPDAEPREPVPPAEEIEAVDVDTAPAEAQDGASDAVPSPAEPYPAEPDPAVPDPAVPDPAQQDPAPPPVSDPETDDDTPPVPTDTSESPDAGSDPSPASGD